MYHAQFVCFLAFSFDLLFPPFQFIYFPYFLLFIYLRLSTSPIFYYLFICVYLLPLFDIIYLFGSIYFPYFFVASIGLLHRRPLLCHAQFVCFLAPSEAGVPTRTSHILHPRHPIITCYVFCHQRCPVV